MVANKGAWMVHDLKLLQKQFDVPERSTPGNFFQVAGDLRTMRVSSGCFGHLLLPLSRIWDVTAIYLHQMLRHGRDSLAPEIFSELTDRTFETYWGLLRQKPDEISVDERVLTDMCVVSEYMYSAVVP